MRLYFSPQSASACRRYPRNKRLPERTKTVYEFSNPCLRYEIGNKMDWKFSRFLCGDFSTMMYVVVASCLNCKTFWLVNKSWKICINNLPYISCLQLSRKLNNTISILHWNLTRTNCTFWQEWCSFRLVSIYAWRSGYGRGQYDFFLRVIL